MLAAITVRGRRLNMLNEGMFLVRVLKISKNRLILEMINVARNTFFAKN
jgi:hypothetical protein